MVRRYYRQKSGMSRFDVGPKDMADNPAIRFDSHDKTMDLPVTLPVISSLRLHSWGMYSIIYFVLIVTVQSRQIIRQWGRAMWLRVNPRYPVPVYLQIVNAVKEAVAKGVLKPGERLPTVRELAAEHALNHNTVAKAYQELERDHVILTLGSKGTFVGELDTVPNAEEKVRQLHDLMKTLIVEAYHLRISPSELKRVFATQVDEWTEVREARERYERHRNARSDEDIQS